MYWNKDELLLQFTGEKLQLMMLQKSTVNQEINQSESQFPVSATKTVLLPQSALPLQVQQTSQSNLNIENLHYSF